MQRIVYSGLLLLIVCFWGWTFVVVKDAIAVYGVMAFLAIRFTLGTLAIAPFAVRHLDRRAWGIGALIGLALGPAYMFQTYGLRLTTPTNGGLITGLFIVFAPLCNRVFFGVRTKWTQWIAIAASVGGLALLTFSASPEGRVAGSTIGDALTLGAAALFGLQIALLDRHAARHDASALAFIQLGTAAAIFVFLWPFVDTFVWPSPQVWFALGITSVIGTAAGFYIQTLAQQHLSALAAAAIFFLEPLFAAFFGYLLAGDRLSSLQLAGGALMIVMMAIMHRPQGPRQESAPTPNARTAPEAGSAPVPSHAPQAAAGTPRTDPAPDLPPRRETDSLQS